MSNENEQDTTDQKVEIFERVNRLKIKAGSQKDGPDIKFSKERLENPKKFFEDYTQDYDKQIESVLEGLEDAWKTILSGDETELEKSKEDLYHKANHAKDLAATCDYPLMQHFARSLREFIENISPDSEEHQTIVRAHLDVMWKVHRENITDSGGEKAQELKDLVEKAIEMYK